MTKAELIEEVHKGYGKDLTKKQVAEIVDGVFFTMSEYFVKARVTKGHTPKLTYPGFGTFKKKKRMARKGRNPKTGGIMTIPSSLSLTFAPGQELKRRMNK